MADKCDRVEKYPNGMIVSVERAIKSGDFQIAQYACKGCRLGCSIREEDEY